MERSISTCKLALLFKFSPYPIIITFRAGPGSILRLYQLKKPILFTLHTYVKINLMLMRKENMDSNAQFEAKIPAERILNNRYLNSKFLSKEITNLKKKRT